MSLDLRSGCAFWPEQDGPGPEAPDLDRDIACDVVVVGAGVTGALTAWHLATAGLDVVVLDRRAAGAGSTAASTSLIQYELDTPLLELRTLLGRDHADRAYAACVYGVERLGSIADRLGLGDGYRRTGSVYLAVSEHDADALRDEGAARRGIGIDVEYLDGPALRQRFGFDRPGALVSAVAAEGDPLLLTRALLHAARGRGARLFVGEGAAVASISAGEGVTLTAGGGVVRGRGAVLATGYEAQQYLERPVATLQSTYAFATEPLPAPALWPERCLIWATARPYLYLRTTCDNRIMGGGEDEPIVGAGARDALLPAKADALLRETEALLPGRGAKLEYVWAGTFAETPDALPCVDQAAHLPNVWFALGYGANGTTCSVLAAEIIRDGILGRPNPRGDLFRFDRPSLREG